VRTDEYAFFTMNSPTSIVFVVDDDEHVRNALCRLLRSGGYTAEGYGSASAFLHGADLTSAPACLLLDLQLPDLSGIELQQRLEGRVPIVFVSAHGDMNTAVQAMKAGAMDFLAKPFRDQDMLDAVANALATDAERRKSERSVSDLRRMYESLTPREREVMAFVASGLMNKQIAGILNVSEITVKIHRGQVMKKMEARSLAELVKMAETLGISRKVP